MQEFFHHFVLFFQHNEWFADVCILLVGMSLYHWLSRKIYHFLMKRFENHKHPWMNAFVRSVHVPWMTFFWLLIFSFVIQIVMLHFHIDISKLSVVNIIRSFLFIGTLYWSLLNFITRIEFDIAPHWQRLPIRDKTTVRAIAQLTRIVLTMIAVLMMLPMLGFETSSLVAFGGVGGIAVGFAAKDTLSNFLGGMMIFWDRPFSVGDWIRSPDRNIEGYVEHIGWRLTRIRTLSKRALYVPNAIFSSIAIENPSRMSHRQINTNIGVRYDDAKVVPVIVKEIEDMLKQHPGIDQSQTVVVHLVELASSSLNLNLYAFTKTTDFTKFRQIMQDIFLKSIAIITKHGAECAFPTTTVLMPNHDNSRHDHE